MKKQRLDLLLVEKGLAESRTLAQKLIMAGSVRVNGNMVIKPAVTFSDSDAITIDRGPRFVSRGGEKLIGALESFHLTDLSDLTCVDVGSSTGGFTDCMLQHGAKKVYAIDVGYGLLHWKLRQDARVTVMEKTNARDVRGFPEPVQLAVVDASFISRRIHPRPLRSGTDRRETGRYAEYVPGHDPRRIDVRDRSGCPERKRHRRRNGDDPVNYPKI